MLARMGTLQIVGEVTGSSELADVLESTRPDVILFDDDTDERWRLFEFAKIAGLGVVVIGCIDDAAVILAGSAGNGWGVVLRDATPQELSGALIAASAALDVADPRVTDALARHGSDEMLSATNVEFADGTHRAGALLSPREKEVLELISRGMPNKQIAAKLGISSHTVKFHIGSLLVKLGAASRAEAVTIGARRGELLL